MCSVVPVSMDMGTDLVTMLIFYVLGAYLFRDHNAICQPKFVWVTIDNLHAYLFVLTLHQNCVCT